MKAHRTVKLAVVLLATFVWVSIAVSGYLPRWKLWQMAGDSELILTGTVQSVNSVHSMSPDEIYTLITVSPDSVIKGSVATPPVTIRQMGGTVDSISEYVTGSPTWAVPERVLLFLQPSAADSTLYQLTHYNQGKVNILLDADDEEALFWYPVLKYPAATASDSLEPAFAGDPEKLSDMIASILGLLK